MPNHQKPSNYKHSSQQFTCVVCCHSIPGPQRRPIFAIGPCDHSICYHCSTKMRALCQQNECPICRQAIPDVIFTEEYGKKYADFGNREGLIYNRQFKIFFETDRCLDAFSWLLKEKCNICRSEFDNAKKLNEHLEAVHRMFLCELCVKNLKIFSDERKYYRRQMLDRHLLRGDPDDRSYQGHPSCRFCNRRFMDQDELSLHQRRDHFFCHLCDPTQTFFYRTYEELSRHFRHKHYLCEEEECINQQFIFVFRNEIDLRAHRAEVHCLTKSEIKNARTLTLDLTFNPYPRTSRSSMDNPAAASFRDDRGNGGRRRHTDRQGDRHGDRQGDRPNERNFGQERVNIPIQEEDYDLYGAAARPTTSQPQQLPRPEDFPSLGEPSSTEDDKKDKSSQSNTSGASNNAASKVNKSNANNPPKTAPRKYASKFSSKLSSDLFSQRTEEFPALCAFDGASSLTASSSSRNNVSLADVIKSKKANSSGKEKGNQSNKKQSSSSGETSSGHNKSNRKGLSQSLEPKPSNSNLNNGNSRRECAYENEFPSLPLKWKQ